MGRPQDVDDMYDYLSKVAETRQQIANYIFEQLKPTNDRLNKHKAGVTEDILKTVCRSLADRTANKGCDHTSTTYRMSLRDGHYRFALKGPQGQQDGIVLKGV